MNETLHFKNDELKCPCCGINKMDPEYLKDLEALRVVYNKSMKLTSAYRCPKYNAQIADSGLNGPHTSGKAVDVWIRNPDASKLVKLAIEMGFTGIGVSQKGDSRYIHLDKSRKEFTIWSY